jgi:hypothetical protein
MTPDAGRATARRGSRTRRPRWRERRDADAAWRVGAPRSPASWRRAAPALGTFAQWSRDRWDAACPARGRAGARRTGIWSGGRGGGRGGRRAMASEARSCRRLPDRRTRSTGGPTPSATGATHHPRSHPPAHSRRGERGRAGRDAGRETRTAAGAPSCAQRSAGPVLAGPGRVGVAGRNGRILMGAGRVRDIVGVGEGGEGYGQVDSASEAPAPAAPGADPLRWEGLPEHVFGTLRAAADGARRVAPPGSRLAPAAFPLRRSAGVRPRCRARPRRRSSYARAREPRR